MNSTRQYDLDWLRVIGICGVFLFHNSMFFNDWYWHVGNAVIYSGMDGFSSFFSNWIMPLFFVISGVSTRYALHVRSGSAFLKERVVRLVVPLLLGVFLLSPPQVYIETVTHGRFAGGFWAFFPHYFDGWYSITPNGNFAFMGLHLWYLLILFLFSVVTLPLFFWLRSQRMQAFSDRLSLWAGKPGVLLLFAIPLALLVGLLNPQGAGSGAGGYSFLVYLLYFIYGYWLFANPHFKTAIRRFGPVALPVALVTVIFYIVWTQVYGYPSFGSLAFMWLGFLQALNGWCFLLALFFLGDRYLNRNNRALQYAGRAVMPFYILHQPVIVFLGFWVVRDQPWSLWVKFPLLVLTAFVIVMVLYHFAVRKFKVLAFLFGLKPERSMTASNRSTANAGRM